ncbi:MAG TPA: hypothetical protein VFE51_24490 [Verrucomicrobiae bacterium]|nr:hypothetical protein [Verrucomicrobiae bacterium]
MKAVGFRSSLPPRSAQTSPRPQGPGRPSTRTGRLRSSASRSLSNGADGISTEVSNRALFQVNSVVGQVWLMQLRKRIDASYARLGCGRAATLQTGYAWRSFSTFFEPLSAIEIVRLFENLLQFANFEDYPPARSFFLAYAPLAFEHDLYGEYIGPVVWSPPSGSRKGARRVRRTLQRWCEWMEALTHFQVHREWRAASVCPEVEKAVILLWPLVKRHNWSSAELLTTLRSLTACGERFPCQSQEQLASFCQGSLGLRFQQPNLDCLRTPLPAEAVASRLIKFLPTVA